VSILKLKWFFDLKMPVGFRHLIGSEILCGAASKG
jgi:hypothetical protein